MAVAILKVDRWVPFEAQFRHANHARGNARGVARRARVRRDEDPQDLGTAPLTLSERDALAVVQDLRLEGPLMERGLRKEALGVWRERKKREKRVEMRS